MLDNLNLFFNLSSDNTSNGFISMILMFVAMFAILYFVMIRPQQKHQKRQQNLIALLKKGDEVILSSGIIGRINSIEEKILYLEIGDKIKLKILKHTVQTVIKPEQISIKNNKNK